jgi:pSer/pThr/pTyr-binding forkhead associated (FHA) protein
MPTRSDSPARGSADAPRLVLLAPLPKHKPVPDVPLHRPVTLVGSRRTARLHLSSSTVSKAHCLFVVTPHGAFVRDLLSREGTRINDEPIQERDLADGDEVRIGRFHFLYKDPRELPPAGDRPDEHLLLRTVGSSPLTAEADLARVRSALIGARPGSDLELASPGVSTAHAALVRLEGFAGKTGWQLIDLGGKGTRLDGKPIDKAPLHDGDTLQLGPCEVRVTLAEIEREPPIGWSDEADALSRIDPSQDDPDSRDQADAKAQELRVEDAFDDEPDTPDAGSGSAHDTHPVEPSADTVVAGLNDSAAAHDTVAALSRDWRTAEPSQADEVEATDPPVESPAPAESPAVVDPPEPEPVSDVVPTVRVPTPRRRKGGRAGRRAGTGPTRVVLPDPPAPEPPKVTDAANVEPEATVELEATVEPEADDSPAASVANRNETPTQDRIDGLDLAGIDFDAIGADAKDEPPVAEVEPNRPVADVEPPVAEAEPPVAEVETRVAEVEPPVAEVEPPVAEVEPPVVEPEPPVADVKAPVVVVDTPDPSPETPVAEVETPVAEVEPPIAEVEPPVADHEPPVAEVGDPVADVEPPVLEPEPPVAEPEPPIAEPEPPVADVEPPVADVEAPVAEVDTPDPVPEAPRTFPPEADPTTPTTPTTPPPTTTSSTCSTINAAIDPGPAGTEASAEDWQRDWNTDTASIAGFSGFNQAASVSSQPVLGGSDPTPPHRQARDPDPAEPTAEPDPETQTDPEPAAESGETDPAPDPTPDATPGPGPAKPIRVSFRGQQPRSDAVTTGPAPFSSLSINDGSSRPRPVEGEPALDASMVIPETSGLLGAADFDELGRTADLRPDDLDDLAAGSPDLEDRTDRQDGIEPEVESFPDDPAGARGAFLRTVRQGVSGENLDTHRVEDEVSWDDAGGSGGLAVAEAPPRTQVRRPRPARPQLDRVARQRPRRPRAPRSPVGEPDPSTIGPAQTYLSRQASRRRSVRLMAVLVLTILGLVAALSAIQLYAAPEQPVTVRLHFELPADLPPEAVVDFEARQRAAMDEPSLQQAAVESLSRRHPELSPAWLATPETPFEVIFTGDPPGVMRLAMATSAPEDDVRRLLALARSTVAAGDPDRRRAQELDANDELLRAQRDRLTARRNALQADLERLAGEAQARRGSPLPTAADLDLLRQRIADADADEARASREAAALREALSELETAPLGEDDPQLDRLRTALRGVVEPEQAEQAADLRRRIQSRLAELQGVRDRDLQRLRGDMAAAQATAARSRQEATAVRETLRQTQVRLDDADDRRARLDRLNARLNESADEINRIRQELSASRDERLTLAFARPLAPDDYEILDAEDERPTLMVYATLAIVSLSLAGLYLTLRR